MSITYTPKGTPVMKIGKFQLTLTSTSGGKEKWKWLTVSTGSNRDIVPFTLLGLKQKVVPLKLRYRMQKIFKKYVDKDGFIYKKDVEKLCNDLSIMDEDITNRMDDLLDLLL